MPDLIHQLVQDKLLIPRNNIRLTVSVGQGSYTCRIILKSLILIHVQLASDLDLLSGNTTQENLALCTEQFSVTGEKVGEIWWL